LSIIPEITRGEGPEQKRLQNYHPLWVNDKKYELVNSYQNTLTVRLDGIKVAIGELVMNTNSKIKFGGFSERAKEICLSTALIKHYLKKEKETWNGKDNSETTS
jgi:hypothetical protein